MRGPVICGIEEPQQAGEAMDVARDLAGRYGLPLLCVHVDAEHPADGLVALAGEREASFLVVGCRGPRSSLLGSVSADVSRRAPCPVVVVPPHARSVGGASGLEGGILRLDA